MIHLCRKFEKLFCLLDTNISQQGLWDPIGHLIENLDQRSRGGPMVDPSGPGPMRSGPHLGPHPVAMMQPRRLLLELPPLVIRAFWDPPGCLIGNQVWPSDVGPLGDLRDGGI